VIACAPEAAVRIRRILSLMRLALAALASVLLSSCALLDAPCGCGRSFERDPWNEDAVLSIGPEHAVGVHCICRCGGTGERVLEAPSATCERYETECRLSSGETARWICN
jgi:hypothetical protein